MTVPYTELRWHTEYSILAGCGRLEDHVKRAHALGYTAVAPTEIDSLRGAYYIHEELSNYNKENGGSLRPIFGVELSVVPDSSVKGLPQADRDKLAEEHKGHALRRAIWQMERDLGLTRTWRLSARAMTREGFLNLYKLTSLAWTEGHFIRPRTDPDLLIKYGAGISISLGGPESWALEHIVSGSAGEGLEHFERLAEAFSGRIWLEVQPHATVTRHNKVAVKLSERYNIPLIATNDALYVNKDDTDAHQIVLCIARGKNIRETDAPQSPPGRHLRSGEEMLVAFNEDQRWMGPKLIYEAIERTVEVAALHDAKLEVDRFKALVPQPDLPAGETDFSWLKKLCLEGWDWRDIPARAKVMAPRDGVSESAMVGVYAARLRKELGAIVKQKFTPYFLIVRDLINWARSQGIMVGPGRGSSAGSLVCYLLGITAIDPIEHRLMFERFVSPNRIDMPDIDMDYEDNRRQEVIDYLHRKYGDGCVAHIVTFTRLKGKSALRDVSRALDIPMNEVAKVTSSIIERSSGDERVSQTVEDSFKEFKVCQDFDKKYPQVLPLVKKLEGTVRQTGVHAAGIVTCGTRLLEVVPVEVHDRQGKPCLTTAMDMQGAEAHGLLKLDVLGLRTLSVVKDALSAIKERHGKDIDPENLDLNDAEVLEQFTAHNYVGIFQYDSTGAHAACEGIEFTSFEDVAALTALNRPGTMRSGLATEYKRRKQDPRKVKPFHPLVDRICEDTLGILVYQEQVLRIFVEVAGYEPGTADSLRKKIAKKWGDEAIGKEREKFIEGAALRGVPAVDAGKLMDNITFFGSYGFNKSHASAYGAIAYWGMWLKTYYPIEFMWALMKNEPDPSQVSQYSKECERLGINVLPPDVNSSGVNWTIDRDSNIRAALVDIKNVGEGAVSALVAQQPFTSLADFMERVPARSANSRVLTSLIKAGAMRAILPNTKWALEQLDEWHKLGRKKPSGWEEKLTTLVDGSKGEPEYSDEDLLFIANEVAPLGSGRHPLQVYDSLLSGPLSGVSWLHLDAEDFFNHRSAFVRGVLIEIKYNQVGDFHTVEPDEDEKRRIGWGKRYANVNLEDESGIQHRVKVDIDIFEDFRQIIDKGVGTCVAMHVGINKQFHNLRCHYMADLEEMRQKMRLGVDFIGWERCFTTSHPVLDHTSKSLARREELAVKAEHPRKGRRAFKWTVIGLIANVKRTFDKKGNEMCFFGLQDAEGGHIEVVVFNSEYELHGSMIQAGSIVEAELKKDGQSNFLSDAGITSVLGSIVPR